MLSPARAGRLARRAARPRADGGRGFLARRAWRLVSAAADRGEPVAAEAVWQAWLHQPADEPWQALCRWGDPATLAEAVFAAATEPDREPAGRRALGEFCVRHGLVPDDEIRRALLFMMAGLPAQHRAADPDGSRLAAAYRAETEPGRAALRAAMAQAGDLDLVRVVGARRPGRLTPAEAEYLIKGLLGRQDWPELWRLVRDLPLLTAVRAMPPLRMAWHPAGDPGRALFDLLARADPATIGSARDALHQPWVLEFELEDAPTTGAFSPDGRLLLMATERDGRYSGCRVLELPGGTVAERHDYAGDLPPAAMVHVGEAFFVVGVSGTGQQELVRYTAGGPTTIIDWHRSWITIAPYPEGFVRQRWDCGPALLQFGDARGEVTREVATGPEEPLHLLAADTLGGRLAVRGPDGLCILGGDTAQVVASVPLPPGYPPAVCFLGPDRIAVYNYKYKRATLYQIVGDRLEASASRRVPATPLPLRDAVAVCDGRAVRYLSAGALVGAGPPRELPGNVPVTALWGSADGGSHAFGGHLDGRGAVEVCWAGDPAVTALASRPLGEIGPADLATAAIALRGLAPSAARPFLALLKACLELKLGADVAIGQAGPTSLGEDDIAVSGGPPC